MSGLATWLHRRPFQCTIRGLPAPWLAVTAQAFVLDVAATAVNTPDRRERGNGARFHAVPFQCKISGLSEAPTAHAFAPDVAATPNSLPSAGAGVGTRRAVMPVRRTMRSLGTLRAEHPGLRRPTPGNAATAFKEPRDGSAGLLTVLQAAPFQ
jgi:hypothetical protein